MFSAVDNSTSDDVRRKGIDACLDPTRSRTKVGCRTKVNSGRKVRFAVFGSALPRLLKLELDAGVGRKSVHRL